MSKRPPALTFTDTPLLAAERRKAGKEKPGDGAEMEMLSARVKEINARQFRAYAKLKGTTVQIILDQAIEEFLERHRV
jgi:hypothetical protein